MVNDHWIIDRHSMPQSLDRSFWDAHLNPVFLVMEPVSKIDNKYCVPLLLY